eukprot:SAG11_NODE_21944_length_415_cov_1.063291_2_plen_30_part_01
MHQIDPACAGGQNQIFTVVVVSGDRVKRDF